MTKEELRDIYFGFYDQLNEPERSRAKYYYDRQEVVINNIPNNLEDAICGGFTWWDEKVFDWNSIRESVLNGKYFKENKPNVMTKEELRDIYFGFYDQLNEPERSRAKKNWNYEWVIGGKIPNSIRDAINRGFQWKNTFPLQGQDYWWRISQYIEDYLVKENKMDNNSKFKGITEAICELLEEKDKRYGSALDNPLEIFAGKSKHGVRIDEKLSRIKNSEKLRLNDVADIMGYLTHVIKEQGWTKEDILKLID